MHSRGSCPWWPSAARRVTVFLSFLLWAWPLLASSAPLTLQQATQRALKRAPLLDARRAGVTAANEERARAGALPDPVLTVGIDNLPVTGGNAFDFAADEMTMQRIGVRQDIPARAKREAQRTLADRRIDEAGARQRADALAVQRATADAWIDLWAARQAIDALTRLHEQAELAAKIAKARVAAGASPDDALAAQAAVLDLDNRTEEAVATHEAARAALARWVGDGDADPTGTPDFDRLPVADDRLLAEIDRAGDLLPLDAQVETAAAAVDAARAERHPDWSIAASYGRRAGERSDMVTVEVGIGLPLFTRTRQDHGIAAREADYDAALADREDRRRELTASIRAALALWHGLQRQVALYEHQMLPVARDRSMLALAAYRAGGPLQPWLDARRDELAAQLAHAQQLGELGRAWAALAYLLPSETQP
ncbi:MAG: TolC family protein [Proteobacteria bacterium]|nr:TolC family protein [Pseudomonadota bacterium]MBS0462566.1 TolC family protein [Pseudomonadota bacterium]MBS0463620.1 TolC family protein [Pseudomonadota bacterium]